MGSSGPQQDGAGPLPCVSPDGKGVPFCDRPTPGEDGPGAAIVTTVAGTWKQTWPNTHASGAPYGIYVFNRVTHRESLADAINTAGACSLLVCRESGDPWIVTETMAFSR